MNHLLRELAPVSSAAWEEIETEAKSRLRTYLGARSLVDFRGPHGWGRSAIDLGRVEEVEDPSHPEVRAQRRQVLPLVELRAPFTLDRGQLGDIDRGRPDPDLGPLDDAARVIARAETAAVFHGYPAGGIDGIAPRSSHRPVPLGPEPSRYSDAVAGAVQTLMGAGVGGPFGLALSSDLWAKVAETIEGGYPLVEHLRRTLEGGPMVWAPGLEGAVVVSQRGGDFLFDSGQDLSIGYLTHDAETLTLYLEESFTFRVLEEDAAVALTSP
jgi:uncharacterized linocin/CFP29 family protein